MLDLITQRCLELIRNGVVLYGYPVSIPGSLSGFDNAPLGPIHHIIDDWDAIAGIPRGRHVFPGGSRRMPKRLLIGSLTPVVVRTSASPTLARGAAVRRVYRVQADECYRRLVGDARGGPTAACIAAAGPTNKLKPLRGQDVSVADGEHRPEQGLFATLAPFAGEADTLQLQQSITPQPDTFVFGSSSAYYDALHPLTAHVVAAAIDRLAGVVSC